MISRKHLGELLFLVMLSIIWFVMGWVANARFSDQNPESQLIEQVRQTLLENHVDDMPSSRELTYGALRGMIQQIDDPHAAFLEPLLAERFQADFSGNSGIIGLFPERIKGEYVVTVILPGGAAEAAGLQVGDVIESVDGVSMGTMTTSADVSLLLRGPVGTAANVVVQRDGEHLTFRPIRDVRDVISGTQMLDGNIAYFAQHTFTSNSPEEVTAVLQEFVEQDAQGIVWDLRSNGGGSMEAAQAIISNFIEEGLLFQIELKGGDVRLVEASGNAIAGEIPLVILVGGTTFSAAETAAASIQDHGRGVLMGDTTYGKGTVQTTLPMPEGTAVQFTIAHWLSPNGEWFDGRGVEPDIKVIDDPETSEDEVINRAIEWLLENRK